MDKSLTSVAALWLGAEPLDPPVREHADDQDRLPWRGPNERNGLPWHGPGCLFELTLRRADGTPLGLQCKGHNGVLFIKHVRPHGAVEALNRLCAGTHREVRPGDLIVKVNDICCDAASMAEECCKERLLKLTLVRGPRLSGCSLHADAPEFVPGKRWPPHHEEEQQLEIAEERRPEITYHTLSKSTKTIQKKVEAALRAQGISSGKWLFLAL